MTSFKIKKSRPLTPIRAFNKAFEISELTNAEKELIQHIRHVGVFNQVSLIQDLRLSSKPPALSVLCEICRKLGKNMPEHFAKVREWSKEVSEHGVYWDGDLICSLTWNVDGERLTPETGTTQYHTFVVHKELFQGLN